MLTSNEYDHVLQVAMEEAPYVLSEHGEKIKEDEDKFHDILFDRVLSVIDDSAYSYLEARDVSEVCGEVEGDIIHGDITGL